MTPLSRQQFFEGTMVMYVDLLRRDINIDLPSAHATHDRYAMVNTLMHIQKLADMIATAADNLLQDTLAEAETNLRFFGEKKETIRDKDPER